MFFGECCYKTALVDFVSCFDERLDLFQHGTHRISLYMTESLHVCSDHTVARRQIFPGLKKSRRAVKTLILISKGNSALLRFGQAKRDIANLFKGVVG
jgi:hypothetical protein